MDDNTGAMQYCGRGDEPSTRAACHESAANAVYSWYWGFFAYFMYGSMGAGG